MPLTVPFVKGHCGWDAVTLLPEGIIPVERELDVALKILDEPIHGGLEVGFLGKGERVGEIKLRMVDSTARTWISMCGGMSQVIGKALVESSFREQFGLDISGSSLAVQLHVAVGVIPLEIEIAGGRARRITTVMDDYVRFLYRRGVTPLTLGSVPALQADDMVMVDIAALERAWPGVDFTRRDAGPHLEIVNDLLVNFARHNEAYNGGIGMLYDDRPEGPGQFRIFPRFWGGAHAAARLPFEFQCGTGSIGLGIALAHSGRLPFQSGEGRVILEWGSQRATPDPYGIRVSDLTLDVQAGHVSRARFSHSVVELLAEGTLRIPSYAALSS